jgi:hypothetical protein
MAANICPSLFFIVPDKNTVPYNTNDIFRPDGFRILQAEKLTHVKEIITNTYRPLQVRVLCCYRMKDLIENYCMHRHVEDSKKQVCNQQYGINTDFIHFHVSLKNPQNYEYLLAFIEDAELCGDNINILISELFYAINWLEISSQVVWLNIFTFGEPRFGTKNTSYIDNCIDSLRKQEAHKYKNRIEYDIKHISNDFENRLSISLKNNKLSFIPS